MDSVASVLRSSLSFFSGTLLSRVSGFAREIATAFYLGAHPSIAAFFVAYRLANLLRRLLGETALTAGTIPHFEAIRADSRTEANAFFLDMMLSLVITVSILIGCIEGGLWAMSAQSFISSNTQEIFSLIQLLLPGLLFICLYGLNTALLHCEGFFFLSSAAPILFNVTWITTLVLSQHFPPEQTVINLAMGIVCAFFLQWLVTVPRVLSLLFSKTNLLKTLAIRPFSKQVRKAIASLSLGVIGIGATQLNSFLDVIFARSAAVEGPAYLTYAIRIQQAPLALFGIALSSALLPSLSRAWKAKDTHHYIHIFTSTLARTVTLIAPCFCILMLLGAECIELAYVRGRFSDANALQTTHCLWGYSWGLFPMVLSLLLAPAFYARNDYWTPSKASLISVGANIFFNTLFISFLNFPTSSLAYATSLSACIHAATLLFYFPPKQSLLSLRNHFYKIIAASLIACSALLSFSSTALPLFGQVFQFLAALGVFLTTFFVSCWLLRVEEIVLLIKKISKS